MAAQAFEKLGVFYLGRPLDPKTQEPSTDPLLYDSRDLTTHAMCVGMTGSGKTGLCIALLEEAAIDGIPALVVDPKGDLTNLLLTFPDLAPRDFRPWVREDDAQRKGLSRDDYAAAEAKKWKDGLAKWGEDGARIQRLRDSVEFAIYTPGSDLVQPISILASFAAPPKAVLEDGDLLRDRVSTTATSLLSLLGIDGDPLKSREHILLATLLDHAWQAGKSYDLASLIADIQKPPVATIGVMAIDTSYPPKDRFDLALQINNLLAAPGFDVWMRGAPLDPGSLLYTAQGKPRISILTIAHLSDKERMFFVSLLLDELLGWIRSRSGSNSLRALFYMDEVFGYLPPVANPPSKKPLLTLLKQARAFGLGLTLATQNPVDLDYKALSNIGTWFLGRLQTERDKARVLDGLEGAAASSGSAFDRSVMDTMLSGLKNRVFLLHNVHDSKPELFESRWAMSYLAGPLDRQQLRRLTVASAETSAPAAAAAAASPAATAASTPAPPASAASGPPVLPPGVPQAYIPLRSAQREGILYAPRLLGIARVHIADDKLAIDETSNLERLFALDPAAPVDWSHAEDAAVAQSDLETSGSPGATFAAPPPSVSDPKSFKKWQKELADSIYQTYKLELMKSPTLNEVSKPGESEKDFRLRLTDAAREERDRQVEALRKKYATRVASLDDKLARANERVEREKRQETQQTLDTVVSIGSTVLGALFGRRALSRTNLNSASRAARKASRALKETQDVGAAKESVAALTAQQADLQSELQGEIAKLSTLLDPSTETFDKISIRPKKGDIDVRLLTLAWAPQDAKSGTPLWR